MRDAGNPGVETSKLRHLSGAESKGLPNHPLLFWADKAATPKQLEAAKDKLEKLKARKLPSPLQEVLGKHFARLSPWATSGFFTLPLELVLELHAHGFKWGATFGSNADLHHFELDDPA